MSMTAPTALAAAAGAIAALGITELARDWSPRSRRSPLKRLARAARARAGHRLAARAPRELAARLEAAGLDTPPGDVMAAKTGAALVALLATLPLAAGLAPLTAAGAFHAPDLLIRRHARRRRATIDAELGDVLDLLRVAVAAGLSPGRALAEVGRRHAGTLARELERAAQAVALGLPLDEALSALERRAPAAGIGPFAAALRRAARHGAPLGPSLAAQAAEARARTARRHTEAAARAAPQVQLVVALLLVPSVLLLVAAALLPA
jgi:tight adherence protein C